MADNQNKPEYTQHYTQESLVQCGVCGCVVVDETWTKKAHDLQHLVLDTLAKNVSVLADVIAQPGRRKRP